MTAPFCPECGPTCPLHSTTAFLDPLHDELDRLRTDNAQLRDENDLLIVKIADVKAMERYRSREADAAEHRAEQAEARVDQLTDQLTLANDTLRHRGNAVNATGHTNDRLRAQLATIGDAYKRHHKALPLAFIADVQRSLIALDQEPTSE